MKKLLLITMILSNIAHAGSEPTASPFPGAKKGINIWSMEKLSMPMKQEAMKIIKTFAEKGYNQTTESDESVNSLFQLAKNAKKETSQYDKIENPLDTHLKSDISKLDLSFKFSGIPEIAKENIFGFAPAGGYKKEKGWDGVVEFAQIPNLGICSFTTFSIESVILYKESTQYLVNNKPSEKNISGNWNTGFLYHINWYTDTRRNSFECANKILKKENLNEMVRIAKKIDSHLNDPLDNKK